MEYYNHFAVPGGSKIGLFMSPNPTPVCVLTLTPTPIWTSTLQLSNTAGNYPYTYLEMQTLQYTCAHLPLSHRVAEGPLRRLPRGNRATVEKKF